MPSSVPNTSQPQPPSQPQPQQQSPVSTLSLISIALALVAAVSALLYPSIRHSAATAVSRFTLPFTSTFPLSIGSISSVTTTTTTATTTLSIRSFSSTPKRTMPKAATDREWNVLADGMDRFHTHFRYEFNHIYTLADGGFHKEGMNLQRFIREAQQLAHHLDMHHRIEEAYIFPQLAKKMPQFKDGAREKGRHLISHRKIHDGLDKYEAFLSAALESPSSYNALKLREIMDGFKEVLFTHLDEEVKDLGHESMKAAGWTIEEIRRIPM